jgi:hypothetical protein
MGIWSLGSNVLVGNWVGAAIDAGGIVIDVGATLVPCVPGGAGTAIKVGRGVDEVVEQVVKHADDLPVPKGVTKSYGSKGKPDHRKKVSELEEKALNEALPGETVLRERRIRRGDSRRIPDVQILDENFRTRKVFEAERRPESRRNKIREAEYGDLGIEYETFGLN